jgi:hypothetical protein
LEGNILCFSFFVLQHTYDAHGCDFDTRSLFAVEVDRSNEVGVSRGAAGRQGRTRVGRNKVLLKFPTIMEERVLKAVTGAVGAAT